MDKVFEIKAIKTQQFTTRIIAADREQAKQIADEEVEQAEEKRFIFTGMKIDVEEIR